MSKSAFNDFYRFFNKTKYEVEIFNETYEILFNSDKNREIISEIKAESTEEDEIEVEETLIMKEKGINFVAFISYLESIQNCNPLCDYLKYIGINSEEEIITNEQILMNKLIKRFSHPDKNEPIKPQHLQEITYELDHLLSVISIREVCKVYFNHIVIYCMFYKIFTSHEHV